jgi:GDP-L-fucose synthase
MVDSTSVVSNESSYSLEGKRVWVAGHRGMVGSALVRRLARENCEIVTADRVDADLTRQDQVERWMETTRPQVVFISAAKVGGILANNSYPAKFLYENLMIESNIIHTAYKTGVEKLLFLGSSCIYPRMASQPIQEEELLSGPLEPTNEWYAVAKIAGLKLCQAYRREFGCNFLSAMPTNLYGPGDNFDLDSSHVIPALMRKAVEAKERGDREIVIWGTGSPRREFLHVDDAADALVHLMRTYSGEMHINVGSGKDISIFELTELINNIVGYTGKITKDTSKPDGTPRKLLQVDRLAKLGWSPSIPLRSGLEKTLHWFLDHPRAAL